MKELVVSLLFWISSNSPMVIEGGSIPDVVSVDKAEILQVAFGEKAAPAMRAKGIEVFGLYNYEEDRIYLLNELDLTTIKDKAVLLHEIVHYLQYKAGDDKIVQCKNQLESLAYHVEADYLEAHGESIALDHDHIERLSKCPKA